MSKKSIFPNPSKAIKQILGGLGYALNVYRGWLASLPDWGKLIVWIIMGICFFILMAEWDPWWQLKDLLNEF